MPLIAVVFDLYRVGPSKSLAENLLRKCPALIVIVKTSPATSKRPASITPTHNFLFLTEAFSLVTSDGRKHPREPAGIVIRFLPG